jgi:hypothetical protein
MDHIARDDPPGIEKGLLRLPKRDAVLASIATVLPRIPFKL